MAFVRYKQPHKGRMSAVIPHAKAVEIKAALKDGSGLTAKQLEYIENIKGVYLGSEKPKSVPVENKLTNIGIYQSRDMGVPTNDQ